MAFYLLKLCLEVYIIVKGKKEIKLIDIFLLLKSETVFLVAEIIAIILVITGAWACVHVILYKRDPRAAAAWLGLIILTPGIGTFLYFAIGINRIRRAAGRLKGDRSFFAEIAPHIKEETAVTKRLTKFYPEGSADNLKELIIIGDSITGEPLTRGNSIEMYTEPKKAFDEMLKTIDSAKRTIALQTYIFDNDMTGKIFCDALLNAIKRGVSVKVLIDDVGSKYSKPSITKRMKEMGIHHALFLEAKSPLSVMRYNLRNHRKALIIDGHTAFTGGMNIRDHYRDGRQVICDTHFKLKGPIVNYVMKVFAEDWFFTTGVHLNRKRWFRPQKKEGDICARVIESGPDKNYEKAYKFLLSAVSNARHRLLITSPYFLPDDAMLRTLSVAALEGVEIKICVPENNNLKYVKAAMDAHMSDVIACGCEVYSVPGPFDHTKCVIVDDDWMLIGTTNWDNRSFRLNFELDVEVYGKEPVKKAAQIFMKKLSKARKMTVLHYARQPLLRRVKNGIIRLLSPYL